MVIDISLDDGRGAAAWMVGSFLVVFLVTRVVTRLIRAGRGPFADTVVGGVHLHHLVYGIFLMLVAGAGEITYRPDGWWQWILAAAFGAGAALTFDEFALWLHLSDVYWEREGRLSVDVTLVVGACGTLLVLGANPFDTDAADGAWVVAAAIVLNVVCAVVCVLKGKLATAVIGVFLPIVSPVGAVRLAKPTSWWARRRHRPGSRRDERARRRYPEGRRTHWDALVDAIGGVHDRGPA